MKISGSGGAKEKGNKKEKSSNQVGVSPKLLIRNLPFEASKHELRELFK
jgi:hypothetical protein